tara:strand:+ start:3841 stop:4632 length:792 start_codon:yes stop_codon:yes gene_type:complete
MAINNNPEELDFKNIDEKLMFIQSNLKVEKSNRNDFAKFDYRTLSDIFEKVKPLLEQTNCNLKITDDLIDANGHNYVQATATLSDGNDYISVNAHAREAIGKKGMDEPQMTGTASTYARKYACNGLFAIDDTRDPDSMDNRAELHHNGSPVKDNCVTQNQSIIMDRVARDAKTLPKDKAKLKAIAKNGYVISANEAQIHILEAKESQKTTQVGKKIIAEWTTKFAKANLQSHTDFLDENGWTVNLVKKAITDYEKKEKLKESK